MQTLEYNYHLYDTDDPNAEALFRWEYVKRPKGNARYARSHLQGTFSLGTGKAALGLSFKKLHLPTGYVLIEDVFRFLINDLGHRPPCGESWSKLLNDSTAHFFEELSSKPQRFDGGN